jgi:hypothetical protein
MVLNNECLGVVQLVTCSPILQIAAWWVLECSEAVPTRGIAVITSWAGWLPCTGWWWDEQRVAPGLLWWDGTWVWQVFWPSSGRDVKQRGM